MYAGEFKQRVTYLIVWLDLTDLCILSIFRFDIYRKIPKDLTQPTLTGAVISIVCCSFIALLLIVELYSFLRTDM